MKFIFTHKLWCNLLIPNKQEFPFLRRLGLGFREVFPSRLGKGESTDAFKYFLLFQQCPKNPSLKFFLGFFSSTMDSAALVSQFLQVTSGRTTAATARHYLESSNWDLERALHLFFNADSWNNNSSEPLFDHNWSDQTTPSNWDYSSEQLETPPPPAAADNLASLPLFRPPSNLIFPGNFEQAKDFGKETNKWVLLNLQSDGEFNCHLLNRDTWKDETVSELVRANFVFWQVQKETEWGQKVCSYYKIDSFPSILVIDPFTGRKMASWVGLIQPENLLDKLDPFMEDTPHDRLYSLAHKPKPEENTRKEDIDEPELANSVQGMGIGEEDGGRKLPEYPDLPEEPKGEKNLLCRLGIRLPPNGRRIQRNFLLTDSIQLLWSFCYSELDEDYKRLPFKFAQHTSKGSKNLEYDTNLTFEEAQLANSVLSVVILD